MKRIFLMISLCALTLGATLTTANAAVVAVERTNGLEPKEAYKGVVNIITYRADGTILGNGTGVFIDETGSCAAPYALFNGAERAEVIDFKGNRLPVARILGANSTYDLVKFSTTGGKKITFFDIAATPDFSVGADLTLLHYTTKKKEGQTPVSITKVDNYGDYKYLHTTAANAENNIGCPLMNASGQLVGFVQKNVDKADSTSCAIDARFIKDLKISSTAALNSDLSGINIPKALPAGEKDALTYLYMLPTTDSLTVVTALGDFIAAYPENAEGYVKRGIFLASRRNHVACEEDFKVALEKADNASSTMRADEVYNELSKIVYQQSLNAAQPPHEGWTLERAAEEAAKAYAVRPAGNYLLQQGRCLYAGKKYAEAHDKFLQLATRSSGTQESEWSATAQAEAWFYAARALEMSGGDSLKVIALLDSCLAKCPKPYDRMTAQYFLERAQRLQRAEQYRRAVLDYYEYENIIGPSRLNATFYHLRSQLATEARMYQQALDDIRMAVKRQPEELLYQIEEAHILLRAGLYDDAILACDKIIKAHPDAADAYKIKGIAYGQQGKKPQARTALNKAKSLGDENAAVYLEKYK